MTNDEFINFLWGLGLVFLVYGGYKYLTRDTSNDKRR